MRKQTYNKYFNILLHYCEMMHIKLYTSLEEDYALLSTKTIVVNAEQDYENQIAAILHEIGHILDYTHNYKKFKKYRTYITLYKQHHDLTKYQKRELIKIEIRAWEFALSLSKLLKIKLKNFETIKKQNLATYYTIRAKKKEKRDV